MDPQNPPKKLQNLIHRDEASASESPPVMLMPTEITKVTNTVTTLSESLTEEEGKTKKLRSEYKDLESLLTSERKLHTDQMNNLIEENARLQSNVDKIGLLNQMIDAVKEMKKKY